MAVAVVEAFDSIDKTIIYIVEKVLRNYEKTPRSKTEHDRTYSVGFE